MISGAQLEMGLGGIVGRLDHMGLCVHSPAVGHGRRIGGGFGLNYGRRLCGTRKAQRNGQHIARLGASIDLSPMPGGSGFELTALRREVDK